MSQRTTRGGLARAFAMAIAYGLSRTFGVLSDLLHLRSLMRNAVDQRQPETLYTIAEQLG